MSDINITLINSVRKIEIDIAKIKQMVRMLQNQFSKQFAPAVSVEELNIMQQNIIEQTLERVAKSVKRSQFTEYPDQLGKQVIDNNLSIKLLQLKTLSHTIKHNLIDKDFPALSKEWKGILEKHREYYMTQLERMAKDNGFAIYKCKSILKNYKAQQDLNDSLLSSDNMSEIDGGKSPIMVDMLSSLAEMSVQPVHKRS
ncbi:hypothetical protein PHYBLDRAFT_151726 [Phycomyces blakesleeanus NRRL 1555(-)]|uniref:Uncharacterized protein n=1 Tax=Phycomyces blakesleeanus (strain ATCC 8743b / DSM 1359 / FGSC 10004 / NBRC 33097 / NRRL 1555) TaxID=763407 RepID=A0A162WHC6_PHYB8|nr:hypothetical protein PHYBLDRAFT_151726 [Phycomyces blakesleeanus NRRL 1555(-)]OAD67125.1 hypothetical protein PHYBLDRAFT_151726 [Phycomyces blakesleeanus NRRL 1555(-)]|eukprot:XP_018285165.1 hypothetical protein PHYBLDRAFT_151726 [Phycomyces blakesleeanus NRRL 1555(-)]